MNRATRVTVAGFALMTAAAAGSCGEHEATVRAPSELKVTESQGGAHLQWKDNSDNETEFMIERKAGTGSFTVLTSVPPNTTSHHDATVARGTSYAYRVMAMGKEGHSKGAYSNEVSFSVSAGNNPSDGGTEAGDAGSSGGDAAHGADAVAGGHADAGAPDTGHGSADSGTPPDHGASETGHPPGHS
jgi:hypothetical protein